MGAVTESMFESATRSDAGLVRQENQDALLALDGEGFWAVADGMGGHAAGAHASRLVVERLAGYRRGRFRGYGILRLEWMLERCNRELLDYAASQAVAVVGSTVAMLTLGQGAAVASWCGDSRVYRLRQGELRALTRDHNGLNLHEDHDLLASERALPPRTEALSRAVGGGELGLEHVWSRHLPNDRYLLCTDGLYKELSDEEVREILEREVPDRDACLDALADAWRARGARDNLAMVLVDQTHPERAIPCDLH